MELLRTVLAHSATAAVTLLLVLITALVVYSPQLRLGGGTVVLHGRTVQAADPTEVAELRAENSRLQEALKVSLTTAVKHERTANNALTKIASIKPSSNEDPTVVQVDLAKYLGPYAYMYGISYDPYVCFPPMTDAFPNATADIERVAARIVKELVQEMTSIHGLKPEDVDPKLMYHHQAFHQGRYHHTIEEAVRPLIADPKYQAWRRAISRILARYLVNVFGHLHMGCNDSRIKLDSGEIAKEDVTRLGEHCRDVTWEEAVERLGYLTVPFESIDSIARIATQGTCMTHVRNNRPSFAHWIVEERMSKEWMTFNVEDKEQDKVLLLFDMLYEKLLVFTKQYWMGVITMQNPFDMYSIQDIIYTTKPDLLIETGTANGGSAVLWSGIMELVGLEDSKIVTIDVETPTWNPGGMWGGSAVAREDPTKNKMWNKRVTFIKGFTTDAAVLSQVKAAAQGKKSVMVTLDSGHDKENVAREMEAYCTLVTVGGYCVVEDTKMSRWHSTGPLEAVKEFIARHPEFKVDRKRELLYSHHTMGYLQRVR